MNQDPQAIALNAALTEIKKAFPGIHHSFLFTKKNESIVTGDPETDKNTMNKLLESFEDLKEQAKVIGNLESFNVKSENGKIAISSIDDMYLFLATSENIDDAQIHSISHIIIPTILKTMKTLAAPHLQEPPPVPETKKLVVDPLTGFFAGDSVQIDVETLMEWTEKVDSINRAKVELSDEQNPNEIIDHVRIETFAGNSTLCKVKEINDQKLKGKNIIRMPEKVCNTLEVMKGDMVKVKPML